MDHQCESAQASFTSSGSNFCPNFRRTSQNVHFFPMKCAVTKVNAVFALISLNFVESSPHLWWTIWCFTAWTEREPRTTCFEDDSKGLHHVFVIGDWGGVPWKGDSFASWLQIDCNIQSPPLCTVNQVMTATSRALVENKTSSGEIRVRCYQIRTKCKLLKSLDRCWIQAKHGKTVAGWCWMMLEMTLAGFLFSQGHWLVRQKQRLRPSTQNCWPHRASRIVHRCSQRQRGMCTHTHTW